MKKLSLGFLIAIVAILAWTLPAMAERIALADDDLDRISAGGGGNTVIVSTTREGPGATSSAAATSVGTDPLTLATVLSGAFSFSGTGGWGNTFPVDSIGVKAKAKGKANHVSKSRSYSGSFRIVQ